MSQKDYYKIMGVPQTATDKEIKLAYRRLARKYHPDISKEANAEAHFKEVGEAYEALKDPEKRKIYDRYLKEGAAPHQSHASSQWPPHGGNQAESGSSYDFFESLFGQNPFREPPPSHDIQASMRISLEDAFHGAVKEIRLPGTQKGEQSLRVKIPPGVKSGQKIRLGGQGGSHGSQRGDLYITLEVDKHPYFDVMGNDIYVTLPVSPWEVALGGTISVPTLAGKVDLKVPPGSQGGQTLRLKKRGLPGGDQYVILKIVTPIPTTDTARALYEKMAKEMPLNPRVSMGV